MGDLTTSIEREAPPLATFSVPSLRLPRFEQGAVVTPRPIVIAVEPTSTRASMATPAPAVAPSPPTQPLQSPAAPATPAPQPVAPAEAVPMTGTGPAPAPAMAIGAAPAPTQFTPYVAPGSNAPANDRLARLRGDAMLGLVLGIAAAVVAAALVLAMWASMHGDPPGMH